MTAFSSVSIELQKQSLRPEMCMSTQLGTLFVNGFWIGLFIC